jgi:type IV secretion system protein VirD4
MSATRILWGQLLFVSIVVLGFLWAATEWTAWRLAYQPQLGPAWFMIGRWPIYQPLAFFIWWFKFDAYAPAVIREYIRNQEQEDNRLDQMNLWR